MKIDVLYDEELYRKNRRRLYVLMHKVFGHEVGRELCIGLQEMETVDYIHPPSVKEHWGNMEVQDDLLLPSGFIYAQTKEKSMFWREVEAHILHYCSRNR